MKILLVNKFHYFRGGSEKYYFELAQLLKDNGHEVAFFSMEKDENITTGDKEYFVKETDMNTASKLKAFDVIYSGTNKKLMTQALEDFKPDIVHINNFQRQLSASIIDAIKEKNIPIVMTAHDLNPICPASIMLYKGEICEDCLKNGYLSCIKKSCIKDSKLKSLIGVLEYEFYKYHHIWSKIDLIISPSSFNKNKLIEGKIKYKRIEALPNFINYEPKSETTIGDYGFFLGRLSSEKGVTNLVKAMKDIKNGRLLIAGDGPQREEIEQYIKDNSLENRIILLGYLNQDSIKKYLNECRFVVIPSICNENCPYSILEAMERSKCVIGSAVGGIPELIKDNENGFLFNFDDIDELKNKMQLLFDNKELSQQLGNKARDIFENEYTPQAYYQKLIKYYNEVKNKEW